MYIYVDIYFVVLPLLQICTPQDTYAHIEPSTGRLLSFRPLSLSLSLSLSFSFSFSEGDLPNGGYTGLCICTYTSE